MLTMAVNTGLISPSIEYEEPRRLCYVLVKVVIEAALLLSRRPDEFKEQTLDSFHILWLAAKLHNEMPFLTRVAHSDSPLVDQKTMTGLIT
jgi:hypothetical protein